MIALINSDSRSIPLADSTVQCVVTSPPYYGLRDYGVNGQIGLEQTPAEYVAQLVAVFREVWRVLKDDGVLFLNLGDSYFGSSQTGGKNSKEGSAKRAGRMFSNAQRANSYGTSGKAPEGYQDHDCLCESLCDVCRVVYQSRKSHNDDLLVSMLVASLSESSHAHTESQIDHLPTSDSLIQEAHNSIAIADSVHSQDHEVERIRVVLVSMLGESYPQLLDVCLQRANRDVCLLCARSLVDYDRASDYKTACTFCTASQLEPSGHRMLGKSYFDLAYPHYTTNSLKPKDLLGIPWHVAFALQEDGWYLRSDIIWSKPNPMPESVTDRPTKAHEYVFLLAKRERYFYDAEAIKEAASNDSGFAKQRANGFDTWSYGRAAGGTGIENHNGIGGTFGDGTTRNRRSVWTVATSPYSGAHYATFPPALVEPMVMAGTSQRGECPVCGKAWVRVVEDYPEYAAVKARMIGKTHEDTSRELERGKQQGWGKNKARVTAWVNTVGWRPQCDHDAEPVPQIVLDPFAGSGTVGAVCRESFRHFVGLDLSFKYLTENALPRAQRTNTAESMATLPMFAAQP